MSGDEGVWTPGVRDPDAPGFSESAGRAETLLRVIDALHASPHLDKGMARVLRICRQSCGADLAVLLRQREGGGMETVMATDPAFGRPHWAVEAEAFARPLRRPCDGSETGAGAGMPDAVQAFRSLLSVPINVVGEPGMALCLLASREGAFSPADTALLRRVAKVAGRAVGGLRRSRENAVLASIVAGEAGGTEAPEMLDTPFETLSRAYARMAAWQGNIVDITDELLRVDAGTIDGAIDLALARTGALAGSDRTYVFRTRPPDRLDNTHEWVAPGIAPMIDELQDMPIELLDEWRGDLEHGRPVYIPDVDALPEDSEVRPVLKMQGIRSLLAVPMSRDGVLTGFVGYDAVREHRAFLPTEIQLLKSVANAIGVVIERKIAEARVDEASNRLREERDRLRTTLAAIPDLVLELDAEGRFIGFNTGSGSQPALPPEEFMGRLVEEVLPPELAGWARALMRSVDRQGHSHGHSYPMQIDGEERWFLASAGSRKLSGEACGYVFVIRDVTQRRERERKLRRMGRIAELTSNLVIVADDQRQIEWVNPAFEARSGWTLDEVRGRRPGDFLYSEATDLETIARIEDALREGRPVQAEMVHRSRSGDDYWIKNDIQPLRDANGRLEGFISVQTDITDLQESHRRALQVRAMAIEAASDGIAISDHTGHYVYMNSVHREMFGIPADEDIRQLSWMDLTTKEAAARFIEEEWNSFEKTGTWRGDYTGLHRDGRTIHMDVSLTRTEAGGMLCIARDITERDRGEIELAHLREELQIAQRRETVAHLASGVAHDLNNLVAVVSGTVSLLQEDPDDSPAVSAGLTRIARAMSVARDLVSGLGHLGRPDAPRAENDLRRLVREAIDLLGSARIRLHDIRADLPAERQPVWANRTEALQVILNLALNACEADPEGTSRVSLSVRRQDGFAPRRPPDLGDFDCRSAYTVLTVSDTGPGVDPAMRARLFEPYVTTKGSKGTGLGLPIVASILKDNGASLWFDSVPGRGTEVTVAWPAADPKPAQAAMIDSAGSEYPDLSGKNVLVIDDVADVADVFAEILETDGAVAIAVSDPAEGIALLAENPGLWAAVVTDLDMPEVRGTEVALAAARLNPPVPCVLVTALPDSPGWDRSPFRGILAKPVESAALIGCVRAAVAGAHEGCSACPEPPESPAETGDTL